MARNKTTFTEQQIDYVKDNFNRMKEMDICVAISVSRFHLQEIKRRLGLIKKKGHQLAKVIPLNTKYFNVNKYSNWVI